MSNYYVDEQGSLRCVDKYYYSFVTGISKSPKSAIPQFILTLK